MGSASFNCCKVELLRWSGGRWRWVLTETCSGAAVALGMASTKTEAARQGREARVAYLNEAGAADGRRWNRPSNRPQVRKEAQI